MKFDNVPVIHTNQYGTEDISHLVDKEHLPYFRHLDVVLFFKRMVSYYGVPFTQETVIDSLHLLLNEGDLYHHKGWGPAVELYLKILNSHEGEPLDSRLMARVKAEFERIVSAVNVEKYRSFSHLA